jgi:hypothetical protein
MNSIDKDSISANDTMSAVKTSVHKILDSLNDGEKTTLKDLTDKVVAETHIKVSIANGLVAMVAHEWCNNGGGTINKGRGGGIFKNGKKIRVDPRPRCETCHQVVRIQKPVQ